MNNMLDSHDIYTSINTSVFFDARDGKLSFELLLFLAAVKSIIGKRNFTKTYKSVIINRMYGDKKKTISRYRFDILMDAAIQRKLINKIPAGRGFYISTRYIDSVEFTKAIIEKIKSYNKAKEERLLNGSLILSFKKEITQNLKNERGKKMNEFQFNYN